MYDVENFFIINDKTTYQSSMPSNLRDQVVF